jgi:hypothetical protein
VPLFGLAAAKKVGSSVLVKLLLAAAQHGGCHMLGLELFALPGVEQLCSDSAVQLLRTALQQKYAEDAVADVEYIKRLPAARLVSRDDQMQLATLAQQRGHKACAALLRVLPHA